MSSKTLLLVAIVGAGVLSIVAIVAAANELWWLVTAAAMIVLSTALLAALDANRRVVSLRVLVAKELKKVRSEVASPRVEPVAHSEQDVVGVVRLLQAQYTGRLDRMQTHLENTLRVAGRSDGNPRRPGAGGDE